MAQLAASSAKRDNISSEKQQPFLPSFLVSRMLPPECLQAASLVCDCCCVKLRPCWLAKKLVQRLKGSPARLPGLVQAVYACEAEALQGGRNQSTCGLIGKRGMPGLGHTAAARMASSGSAV